MDDPIVIDDWHPLAASAGLAVGKLMPARLLDRELVLWRSNDGQIHAWQDRCPHRGTRLSIGAIENDQLVCAYHGWRFAGSGRCTHYPALPALTPPATACARAYRVEEHYGLIWVCLGEPRHGVPAVPGIRRYEPAQSVVRSLRGGGKRATHRREFSRHGPLPIRARRHTRRAAQKRGLRLQSRAI